MLFKVQLFANETQQNLLIGQILNCSFSKVGEETYYTVKVLFEKQDLDYILNEFSGWFDIKNDSRLISEDTNYRLAIYNKKYSWWNLTDIDITIAAFSSVKQGVVAKTIEVYAYIIKRADGLYYLYAAG